MESRSLKLKRLLAIDSSDLLYNYISKSEIIFTSIKKKKSRRSNFSSRRDLWNRDHDIGEWSSGK